jgi:mono/diheme cytochrome c family protein
MWRAIAAAGFISLTAATATRAQDDGDVRRGRAFAEQVCSRCHVLQKGEMKSPHPDAPPFPVIARVPGLSALALTVSLQSSHAQMPDFVLDTQERHDVIAFILSLRSTN